MDKLLKLKVRLKKHQDMLQCMLNNPDIGVDVTLHEGFSIYHQIQPCSKSKVRAGVIQGLKNNIEEIRKEIVSLAQPDRAADF
jgi:hypothetical protein